MSNNNLYVDTVRNSNFYKAYYYVDDVMILSCDSSLLLLSSEKKSILDNSIIIFPNPLQNNLNINYVGDKRLSRIDLIDQSGRLIVSKKVSTDNESIFGFADYKNGFYVLKISFADGSFKYNKLQISN